MKSENYKDITDAFDNFTKKLLKEYGIANIPREDVYYCFMNDLDTINSAYMTRKLTHSYDQRECITLNARAQELLREECDKRKNFISIWGLTRLRFLLENADNLEILNEELLKSATDKKHFGMILDFAEPNSPTWSKAIQGWNASTD